MKQDEYDQIIAEVGEIEAAKFAKNTATLLAAAPLEPDLMLEVRAHTMRFIVLVNDLDFPENEVVLVRGALTLGALDPIPREHGIYNALRESVQGFANSANFGGLLMTDRLARFAGITITPLKHQSLKTREYTLEGVYAVLKIQYAAARPHTRKTYSESAGVWQEDKADER